MGYDTTLLFVRGEATGWQELVASVELCCAAYNKLGDLIDKKSKVSRSPDGEKILKQISAWEYQRKYVWGSDGEYNPNLPEKDREKELNKLHKLQNALEKQLPHVYWDSGDDEAFSDSHGDLLIVAELDEVEAAIAHDLAKDLTTEKNYRYWRFDIALATIRAFQFQNIKDNDKKRKMRVILWGH